MLKSMMFCNFYTCLWRTWVPTCGLASKLLVLWYVLQLVLIKLHKFHLSMKNIQKNKLFCIVGMMGDDDGFAEQMFLVWCSTICLCNCSERVCRTKFYRGTVVQLVNAREEQMREHIVLQVDCGGTRRTKCSVKVCSSYFEGNVMFWKLCSI